MLYTAAAHHFAVVGDGRRRGAVALQAQPGRVSGRRVAGGGGLAPGGDSDGGARRAEDGVLRDCG
jgi:hypothetical protein